MARQNFLDHLRLLMILLVVYGHVEMTIGPLGAIDKEGNVPNLVIDDYSYNVSATGEREPSSSVATRYIALARPWCIPLLFWISGSAAAFGQTRSVVGSVLPLLIMTLIGIGLNAFTWFFGPADPECSPFTPCEGKGRLFDFSIVAFSGTVFPLVFQMWFTIYLIVFYVWCTSVFRAMDKYQLQCDDKSPTVITWTWKALLTSPLRIHLFFSVLFYFGLGGSTPGGYLTSIQLLSLDAVFLLLAVLTIPKTRPEFLKHLPLRLVHYAMAAVLVVQVGGISFIEGDARLSTGYLLFLLVAFKQFFLLGYVMMKSKVLMEKEDGDVECTLLSRYWPFCLFLLLLVSQSTNYLRAGNFTWPYYTLSLDRCAYTTFALMVIFIIDRIGRVEHATCGSAAVLSCVQLSPRMNGVGTACYLFHPLCMTLILQYTSIKSVAIIWIACCILCGALGVCINFDVLLSKGGKTKKKSSDTDSNQQQRERSPLQQMGQEGKRRRKDDEWIKPVTLK